MSRPLKVLTAEIPPSTVAVAEIAEKTALEQIGKQLDDRRLKFLEAYISTGDVALAFQEAYGVIASSFKKKKSGPVSGEGYYTYYRRGMSLLNTPEMQDFLHARRDTARTLAISVLPRVVRRVTEIALDPDMKPSVALQAAKLLSDMAGLTETVDSRFQFLTQYIASYHQVSEPQDVAHPDLTIIDVSSTMESQEPPSPPVAG